ncbi:MAG TPA: patatin-like phospholipase family protein [Bacteroidales bacterium]|jgi:NTE family protein|nr:patatin-like phospholipase family protein [Candidatus Cloacimonas acidaminovorans]HOU97073.1 patatin-like phospholipase family protein [Bacteroidales bacterium]HQG53863.1 patatin-like phospholipase family protein [Bacteroidales bacterium]
MPKSVSLVLSSGGSRGLAQIGVIHELERHGFNINAVAGSSIGSVIGGLYAMGKLSEYTDWVCRLTKKDVWNLMDFTITSHGLLKGERVFEKLKTFIPDMNIEDMKIPFTAIATDILNEKEVLFNRGSYYKAIRASVSIPAVFIPVNHDGSILVDGGLLYPVPIEFVKPVEGAVTVIVNLYGDKRRNISELSETDRGDYKGLMKTFSKLISTGNKKSIGYYTLLTTTSSVMIHKLAKLTIEKYKPEIVINIPFDSAGTFDFYKAEELIKLGEAEARKAILSYLNNLRE